MGLVGGKDMLESYRQYIKLKLRTQAFKHAIVHQNPFAAGKVLDGIALDFAKTYYE